MAMENRCVTSVEGIIDEDVDQSIRAYLAKTYLYKAYRQDEKHNVTEINAEDLKQVLTFSNEVIAFS